MVTRLILARVASLLLLTGTVLRAQTAATWELGAEIMQRLSESRPNSVFGGQAVDIGESALSIRASTSLLRVGPVRLRYAAQLLPAIRMSGVETYEIVSRAVSNVYVITGRAPVYGIGIVPLGLDLDTPLGKRVHLGVGAGVGIAGFTRHVPVAASRQRAFTAEWGTRLRVELDAKRALVLGFRWKHTSNGLTAWENPGVDSRMFSAGLSWTVRAPR